MSKEIGKVRYYVIIGCVACIVFLLGWLISSNLKVTIISAFLVVWIGTFVPIWKKNSRRLHTIMEMSLERLGPPESRIDNEYDGYDEYGDDDDDVSDSYTTYSSEDE